MTRVLFVVPHLGGSMRLLADLLRHLPDHTIVPTLLALGEEATLRDEFPPRARVVTLGHGDGLSGRVKSLRAILKEARSADVVVGWAELTPTYLAALAAFVAGKPVVGWVHTNLSRVFELRQRPGTAHRVAMRALYPRLARTVGVSEGVAEDLRERFHLGNVIYLPNCVDVERIRRLAKEPSEDLGLRSLPNPVLVSASALHYQKGLDVLLRSHALLLRGGRRHHLVILGEGSARADLEAQRKALALEETVHMPGFLKNPYPLIARAAGFVLCSRFEGFALALAEAMALGVPAAATDCPSGPAEILGGGRFGILVPVDDEEGMSRAMGSLLDGKGAPLAERAEREGALRRYNCREAAARFAALIEGTAGVRREAA